MALTPKQRQHLKGLAHQFKPIIMIGNAGVTEAVLKEVEIALAHHELLKIRLPGIERTARTEMVQQICSTTKADLVQEIGRIAILYRRGEKPRLVLPK